jgi:hypothetical protein
LAALGPDLPPARLPGRSDFPEQQLQPLPCARFSADNVCGADALRSFVAWASRRSADIDAKYGAVRKARGESSPHVGHSRARPDSAIGLTSVKGPHCGQR